MGRSPHGKPTWSCKCFCGLLMSCKCFCGFLMSCKCFCGLLMSLCFCGLLMSLCFCELLMSLCFCGLFMFLWTSYVFIFLWTSYVFCSNFTSYTHVCVIMFSSWHLDLSLLIFFKYQSNTGTLFWNSYSTHLHNHYYILGIMHYLHNHYYILGIMHHFYNYYYILGIMHHFYNHYYILGIMHHCWWILGCYSQFYLYLNCIFHILMWCNLSNGKFSLVSLLSLQLEVYYK